MSITVREVLAMKEWKNCRIVAGEEGLDREVLYIDSMEVPNIIPWLKKDELLITTGYVLKDREETLLNIVRAMAENHSAGIALKTKFFGDITDKIKRTADGLKVPVIEIPRDMPFIDLANPLMKKIVDVQNRRLEFNKDMNERFLAVQIEGGSFEEIGKILGELLQCRILVTDNQRNFICCYPGQMQQDGWIVRDEYGETTSVGISRQSAGTQNDGVVVSCVGEEEVWMQAVYVKSKCNGYLYAVGKRGQFNEMSEIAIRQAAIYLALEFSKKGLKEQKEYYQDNSFFLDLIGSNIPMEEDAIRRAGGLHWPKFPYRMVVSDIDGFEEIIRNKKEEDIQSIKDDVMQIHKDILNRKKHCFFIGNKSDSFHCLFTKQAEPKEIRHYMEEIQEQVFKTFGIAVTTGISREFCHYYDFQKAYKETRTAIDIGKKKGMAKICFIEEMRMEEAFSEMAKMEVFRKFVSDSLQVLEEHDKAHGSFLLETLRVLTENLGARKETADILYLHRNTLTYRIRQIEQLTGYDLNDPQVLFRLQLAIKVKTYMDF